DGQGFCAKCGTPAAGPPVRSSAPASAASAGAPRPPAAPPFTSQPAPVAPAPQAAALPPKKSGNTLVKVLLIFLVVIFLFGAVGIAGVWYVAHRVNQKVH